MRIEERDKEVYWVEIPSLCLGEMPASCIM